MTDRELLTHALGWLNGLPCESLQAEIRQRLERESALDRMSENAKELGLDYKPMHRTPMPDNEAIALWRHHQEVLSYTRSVERYHGIGLNPNECPPCNHLCRQGRDCPARNK